MVLPKVEKKNAWIVQKVLVYNKKRLSRKRKFEVFLEVVFKKTRFNQPKLRLEGDFGKNNTEYSYPFYIYISLS